MAEFHPKQTVATLLTGESLLPCFYAQREECVLNACWMVETDAQHFELPVDQCKPTVQCIVLAGPFETLAFGIDRTAICIHESVLLKHKNGAMDGKLKLSFFPDKKKPTAKKIHASFITFVVDGHMPCSPVKCYQGFFSVISRKPFIEFCESSGSIIVPIEIIHGGFLPLGEVAWIRIP